jgi:hypothetical protein
MLSLSVAAEPPCVRDVDHGAVVLRERHGRFQGARQQTGVDACTAATA